MKEYIACDFRNHEKKHSDAIDLLSKALEINETRDDLHYQIALQYFEEKNYSLSLYHLITANRINPNNINFINALANLYRIINRKFDAEIVIFIKINNIIFTLL